MNQINKNPCSYQQCQRVPRALKENGGSALPIANGSWMLHSQEDAEGQRKSSPVRLPLIPVIVRQNETTTAERLSLPPPQFYGE